MVRVVVEWEVMRWPPWVIVSRPLHVKNHRVATNGVSNGPHRSVWCAHGTAFCFAMDAKRRISRK